MSPTRKLLSRLLAATATSLMMSVCAVIQAQSPKKQGGPHLRFADYISTCTRVRFKLFLAKLMADV
jgi:hypothetical protein